jgi:hypothetical protein
MGYSPIRFPCKSSAKEKVSTQGSYPIGPQQSSSLEKTNKAMGYSPGMLRSDEGQGESFDIIGYLSRRSPVNATNIHTGPGAPYQPTILPGAHRPRRRPGLRLNRDQAPGGVGVDRASKGSVVDLRWASSTSCPRDSTPSSDFQQGMLRSPKANTPLDGGDTDNYKTITWEAVSNHGSKPRTASPTYTWTRSRRARAEGGTPRLHLMFPRRTDAPGSGRQP